jgi:hypothetical protein
MIVVTELALIAAAVGGSTHALGHDSVIFGSRLDGPAARPPFVCSVAVRVVGLPALEHAAAACLEPTRRGLRVAAGTDGIPTPDNGPVENATAPEASSQRRLNRSGLQRENPSKKERS